MGVRDALGEIKGQAGRLDPPKRQPVGEVLSIFMGKEVRVQCQWEGRHLMLNCEVVSISPQFVVIRKRSSSGDKWIHRLFALSAINISEIDDGS